MHRRDEGRAMHKRALCVTVQVILSNPHVARATEGQVSFALCAHVLERHAATKSLFSLHDYHTGGNALLHNMVLYSYCSTRCTCISNITFGVV